MATTSSESQASENPNSDPEHWLLSNLPHTTVSGVELAYLDTGSGHSTQFFAVDWLVEEFGNVIMTAENPKQQLIRQGAESGPAELERLFGQLDE